MTTHGEKYFDEIMVTLGKKTKVQFKEALLKEYKSIASDSHQMLNMADVMRVTSSLSIDKEPRFNPEKLPEPEFED